MDCQKQTGRSDQKQRLPAVWHGDDQGHRAHHRPAFEIHLALYQAITGPEEDQKAFKQVAPDFFDLIVIDECHRGSASEDSAWREILDYFSAATQVGLTATPKETHEVSSTDYFGDPVYIYSLKEGIEDFELLRIVDSKQKKEAIDMAVRNQDGRQKSVTDFENARKLLIQQ